MVFLEIKYEKTAAAGGQFPEIKYEKTDMPQDGRRRHGRSGTDFGVSVR